MKILITKNNYRDLSYEIRKKSGKNKIVIGWGDNLPKFKEAVFFLGPVLDSLILNDIPFEISNVPFCLMLGYKRYIVFRGPFKKIDKCKKCSYTMQCKGLFLKYFKYHGAGEISPLGINKRFFTDLEKCMIRVLQTENNIPSDRILMIAKRFKICAGCNDGNHVLTAGERLIKKGMVGRSFKRGVYYWRLLK